MSRTDPLIIPLAGAQYILRGINKLGRKKKKIEVMRDRTNGGVGEELQRRELKRNMRKRKKRGE